MSRKDSAREKSRWAEKNPYDSNLGLEENLSDDPLPFVIRAEISGDGTSSFLHASRSFPGATSPTQ